MTREAKEGGEMDHAPRRSDVVTQSLLTLLVGVVIGVLGSHAAFAGRVASVEATQVNQEKRLEKLERISETNSQYLAEQSRSMTDLVRILSRR